MPYKTDPIKDAPVGLALLRAQAGMTQRELARVAAVAPRTVSRLESGHVARPEPATVTALVRALDRDHAEVLAAIEASHAARMERERKARRKGRAR